MLIKSVSKSNFGLLIFLLEAVLYEHRMVYYPEKDIWESRHGKKPKTW